MSGERRRRPLLDAPGFSVSWFGGIGVVVVVIGLISIARGTYGWGIVTLLIGLSFLWSAYVRSRSRHEP